jgi:mitogen-activated protein kinase kinase kinase 5
MHTRLDNPKILSVDTVVGMLLGYRDIQAYDEMIRLVQDLHRVKNLGTVSDAPAIRFNYAFALNRRSGAGDKDAALEVVLNALKSDMNETPDMLCLAGRIYKDKYVASNYTVGFD